MRKRRGEGKRRGSFLKNANISEKTTCGNPVDGCGVCHKVDADNGKEGQAGMSRQEGNFQTFFFA